MRAQHHKDENHVQMKWKEKYFVSIDRACLIAMQQRIMEFQRNTQHELLFIFSFVLFFPFFNLGRVLIQTLGMKAVSH